MHRMNGGKSGNTWEQIPPSLVDPLVQSDHKKTTGRLFVSPLRRLEQAGKLGWGNIQSLNQSTSDDISRRRIVKLKLPSELLQERSQVIEEGSPEKMEILDNSNILDSKQNLESTTTINDQNVTSTSFSFNNTTQAAPSSTTGFGLFNNAQKEAPPVQQTTSIFGSSLQAQKSEEKPAGLFQSQSTTPQPTSIFGSTQGGSLFANQKTTTPSTEVAEKPKEEAEAPKAGGLFGNLSGITGNKPMSGLFNIGNTTAAAPVIEKKESIQEETKAPATEGLQVNTEKTKLFGAAIPSPSGSQSKSLFSSNIKTEGGLPKAGLFGNLMDNKTPASIFGGNAKTPETVTEKAPQTQQAQEQEKPKGGLFGNLSAKTETAPLFGSQQSKTEMVAEAPAEKPKGGLFGNLTSSSQPSTGLFGSSLSNQPKPEASQAPAEKPKGGLFSGMASTQPKTETTTSMTVEPEKPKGGLFSGLTSSQPKTETISMEAEKPKGGLFSGMVSSQPKTETTQAPAEKPKGGLFSGMVSAQPKTETTTSMTVEPEKPKGGLFGAKTETTSTPAQSTTGGGLFGNQPKPETAKGGLFSGMATSQPKTETTPTSMTVEAEKPKGGLFSGMATSQPKTETTPTPATGGLFGSQPKAEPTPTPTPAPTQTQTQAEKPKSLFGGLTSSQPKNESPQRSIQPSSLGSFGHTPAAAQPKKETASPPSKNQNLEIVNNSIEPTSSESALKPEGSKPGLFSGLASSQPASFLGSVNQNKDQTQDGGKPGLFANVLGNKPTEGGPKPGLFSGLAPKPFAGFGEQKDTSADKPSGLGVLGGLGTLSAAKGGLFSGGASSGGSFASLFGSGPSKSSGLFNKPAGGNEGKEDEGSEDEDDEEGDDDPERELSPEADVSKSRGNYQYQQDYEKVMSKKVNKFKPGQKNMLQEGEISLNKKNESYFVIFRDKAKLIRYQGQIIPQVLKTEFLNPRKDALSVTTFSEDKGEGEEADAEASKGKPKLSKDLLKIMFGVPEDCEQFKKELDKIAK